MTAIRMVYLDCDMPDCMSSTSDEGSVETVAEARRHGRTLGWRYHGGKDICPVCRAGDGPGSADPYSERHVSNYAPQ
jgi:hypothetical protein